MPVTRGPVRRRVFLLAVAVLHGILVASATAVRDGLGDHDRWDWGHFLERALLFGFLLWLTTAIQEPLQRFFGPGTPKQAQRLAADRAVLKAVREGVLPDDVDPAQWRQRIARLLRTVQLGLSFYVVLVVVVGALVALTAVRVDDSDSGVLALAAVLVLAAPALLVATRRRLRRVRQLRDGQLPVA